MFFILLDKAYICYMNLKKRTWHYLFKPITYEIECTKCGGSNTTWSEYEHHIWCYDCSIDDPGTPGIFDGPIPIQTAEMFGVVFDRYNMETEEIELFNFIENVYISTSRLAKILLTENEEIIKEKFGETVFDRLQQYKSVA